MATKRNHVLSEIQDEEGKARRDFIRAVQLAVAGVSVAQVTAAIEAGTLARNAADFIRAVVNGLLEHVRTAFLRGGNIEAAVAKVSFDVRAYEAEEWLRVKSSSLITRTVEAQREAIRLTLEEGLQAGRNPKSVALDVVGRISKTTGRRSGGVVGLTGPQAEALANARADLRAVADSTLTDAQRRAHLDRYLSRVRRDRRFDAAVRRAYATETPLANADKIAGRYADRLLMLRGETIARTEMLEALNAGRQQAWNQAIAEGKILPENLKKTWDATLDARTRADHIIMNNQKADQNGLFYTPTGTPMLHPGDTSYGAGAAEVINCRCVANYKADFIAEAMRA